MNNTYTLTENESAVYDRAETDARFEASWRAIKQEIARRFPDGVEILHVDGFVTEVVGS